MAANGSTLFIKQNAKIPHLAGPGSGGLAGEVADLRKDLDAELAPIAPITVDDYQSTAPATADIDAILLQTASIVAPTTYSGAGLDGVVGALAMPYGRNITITTDAAGTPADAPANCVVTGLYRGVVQVETITVSQIAGVGTGLKPFDTVTSLAFPLSQGTGALLSVGFGAGLGVTHTPKARSAATALPFRELMDGGVLAIGVLTVARLWTPSTAPNAARKFALYYEYDPAIAA